MLLVVKVKVYGLNPTQFIQVNFDTVNRREK